MDLDKVEKKFGIKKKKKIEQRFCLNPDCCVYKSYFGNKCCAHSRIVWRTCRFKSKIKGEGNASIKA